jgi:hypothetical protein
LQKNKQTNKQAKMIRKDNYEQKTFDCETKYYNNINNNDDDDNNNNNNNNRGRQLETVVCSVHVSDHHRPDRHNLIILKTGNLRNVCPMWAAVHGVVWKHFRGNCVHGLRAI